VIALAILLTGGAIAWRLAGVVRSGGARAVGDGRHVETYGFDLTPCLVPIMSIVPGGMPKDGVRALRHPPLMTPQQVDSITRRTHRKYLVPRDRVVGVALEGASRAYPIRVLNWHEVVNDTLGGRPIAVTYSPLCDAVVVFDREVDGEVLEFGVSGLLWNSNLLMYEKRGDGTSESLWSQLQGRAIAGPCAASGRRLSILHAHLVHWESWVDDHPATTVLAPDPKMLKEYRRNPYVSYYGSDRLRFPVDPLPQDVLLPIKAPVAIVRAGGGDERIVPYPWVALNADRQGLWRTTIDGAPVIFRHSDAPSTVDVLPSDAEMALSVAHSFWFACYAAREGKIEGALIGKPADR